MQGYSRPGLVPKRTIEELVTPVVLLLALLPGLDMVWHGRSTPRLSSLGPAGPPGALPRVSVVVAARNEGAAVGAAVASLLRQDYSDLEVVVVNDRSTDGTGHVLGELAAAHADRLRVVTIEQLPDGWLGKPHALWVGARQATGGWLLFTDADVIFEPSCLRRAVGYAERAGLDHLTLGPAIRTRGFWLGAFVAFFTYLLVISLRLYRVNDPTGRVGVGLGAFNLLRREAYAAVGTYAAVARRPDDDVRLGQRVRQLGLHQQLLDGSDLLRVEWYPSLRAAILGLEKNFFAGYDYHLGAALASNALLLAVYVWPWLAVWRAAGWARWLLVGTLGAEVGMFLKTRSGLGGRSGMAELGYALVMPVSALLVSYTAVRSVLLALVRGGIRWRDTFYPLSELRAPGALVER
jgi:cellulose synthase/poly-beta-1,6-N-acetylglucosamine synthase-like glycosyltransferase